MQATEQELKWASVIKEASQNDPEIHSDFLCDLEYLQHAIVAKEKVDDALERIRRLQKFKRKFGIKMDGSFEEGMRALKTFQATHPGYIKGLGSLPDGSHIVSLDMPKMFLRDIHSEESLAVYMRGMFYLTQAGNCNIAAMRQGSVSLVNTKGNTWRNYSLRIEAANSDLYARAYPVRIKLIVLMNLNLFVRILLSSVKMVIPKKVSERMVVLGNAQAFLEGASYPQEVIPKDWNGTMGYEELQTSLKERLQERYKLLAEFKLE